MTGTGRNLGSQVENGVRVGALLGVAFLLGFQFGMAAMVVAAGSWVAVPVGLTLEKE